MKPKYRKVVSLVALALLLISLIPFPYPGQPHTEKDISAEAMVDGSESTESTDDASDDSDVSSEENIPEESTVPEEESSEESEAPGEGDALEEESSEESEAPEESAAPKEESSEESKAPEESTAPEEDDASDESKVPEDIPADNSVSGGDAAIDAATQPEENNVASYVTFAMNLIGTPVLRTASGWTNRNLSGFADEAVFENNGTTYSGLLSECWVLAEDAGAGKITLLTDVTAHAYDPSIYSGTSYTENGVTHEGVSHAITRFTGGLSTMTVSSGMSVTLDLNGHVLDRNMDEADGTADRAYTIEIFNGGSLTLTDSVGTGKLTGGYGSSCIDNTPYGSCVIVHRGGMFTLSGAEISGNNGQGAVTGQGTVKLIGNARITDNHNQAGQECNLYVTTDLDVSAENLTDTANIGITAVPGREADAVHNPDGNIALFYSDANLGTYQNGDYIAVGEEQECAYEAEFHSHTGVVYTGTFAEMFARMKTEHTGILKIMKNITVSGTYEWNVWGNATIDFNGHVVKAVGTSNQNFLTVSAGATAGITLTDSTGRVKETVRRVSEVKDPVWDANSRKYTYYISYSEDGGMDTGMIMVTDKVIADFSRLGGLDVSGYGRAVVVSAGCPINITGGAYRSDNGFLHSTVAGSKVLFSGGYIYDCGTNGSATVSGGAFWMQTGESFTMTGGVIAGCRVKQGGAIRADSLSKMSVTGGTITQCYGGYNGGAFYLNNNCKGIAFGSVLLCNNEGGERGGAVMLGMTSATFNKTMFAGNKAVSGGAVQILSNSGSASFTDCMLIGNKATTGGAVSQESGVSVKLQITGSTVTCNQADTGSGVYFEKGEFLIGDSNSIVKNANSNVYLKDGAVMTLSCTPKSMNIGVTTEREPKSGTIQIVHNQAKWDITNSADWFFSDAGYEISNKGEYVIIGGNNEDEADEAEFYDDATNATYTGTLDEMWAKIGTEHRSGTLKLLRDVYVKDKSYELNYNGAAVTFDLNGHTIYAQTATEGKNLFVIYNCLQKPFILKDSTGEVKETREIVETAGNMSYDKSNRILTYYVQYPNADNTSVITEKVTADFSNYGGFDVTGYSRALYVGNTWIDIQGGAYRSTNGILHSVWELTNVQVSGGYFFDSGKYGVSGGAFYIQTASAAIDNATIVGCRATNGGGINVSAMCTVSNSTITQCEASYAGGGIFSDAYGKTDVNDSLVCLNKSNTSCAGGIQIGSGSLTDVKLIGNQSGENGGALAICNTGTVTIDGCVIMNNTAKENGGGISIATDTPNTILKNVMITQNIAAKNGGGLYMSTGSVYVYDGVEVFGNAPNNLYLAKDNMLTIDSELTEGVNIHVTTEEKPTTDKNVPIIDNVSKHEMSDVDKWIISGDMYYVWYDDGYVYLSITDYEDVNTEGVVVQFYAYTERLDFAAQDGHQLSLINTAGGILPKNNMTPRTINIYVDNDGNVITNNLLTQIYATKVVEPGTVDIDAVNSFYRENYSMYQIWVAKPGTKANSMNPSEWDIMPYEIGMELTLEIGDIVRVVATQTDDIWNTDTIFYDYDIMDGGYYLSYEDAKKGVNQQPTSTQPGPESTSEQYINTEHYGINSIDNYRGSGTKLSFGNANMGVDWQSAIWYSPTGNININQYNRSSNGVTATFAGASYGIPSHLDENGCIVWSDGLDVPFLFNGGAAEGKSTYTDYGFNFIRQGDTYTLSSVTNTGLGNLEKFHNPGIYDGVQHSTIIWSNGFWPMDYAPSYGADGHDLKFGSPERKKNNSLKFGPEANPPVADAGLDHNPYFGFQFEVTFSMPEGYRGPMEYVFFGDDDMWVFLDGKLICDIGGVHSAIGEYVNLWNYLEKDDMQEHKLSVFYTERGASGSTCWMQFTLPNVVSATEIPATFAHSFDKTDEEGNALVGAQFTLYEDEACTKVLDVQASNENGRVTFTDLMSGQVYYIKETKAPEGYQENESIYVLAQNSEGTWYIYQDNDDEKLPVMAVINRRDNQPLMPNTGSVDALHLMSFGSILLIGSILIFGLVIIKKNRGR